MDEKRRELIRKYEQALKNQAEWDIRVKVIEMEVKLTQPPAPSMISAGLPQNSQSRTTQNLEEFNLERLDYEFLEEPSRTAEETARYLGYENTAYARKLLARGVLKPGRQDRKSKRMFCTKSVVEYMFNGETKEGSNGDLDTAGDTPVAAANADAGDAG